MGRKKIKQAVVKEQPIVLKEQPVITVQEPVSPEPTKFVLLVDGKYLKKWSSKAFTDKIEDAKVCNYANAEYFRKEIGGKIFPVD